MIQIAAAPSPADPLELTTATLEDRIAAAGEADRVREASSYDALAPGLPRLTELAREAAAIAATPVAVVNLMTASVQRTVAAVGIETTLLPRVDALCNRVVGQSLPVHVADAAGDPRFSANPFVDGRRGTIRFYAGHPLLASNGLVIGTLCVIDVRPRTLHPVQVEALDVIATEVVGVLEGWRRAKQVA